jgi:citrate lyase subunit beta/citryl-CoA lyase
VVNAARAVGVQPIDTVYGDVDDLEGLSASCRAAQELGFEGKGCVHPRQVPVVNEAFTPSAEEVERARTIVLAHARAERQGHGVVTVGSRMVDAPVVRRALRTVELAQKMGRLATGWQEEGA